jgi:thymidine phosphorylase
VCVSDGTQPVGWGIGPALEARDAIAVLRNEPGASRDLRERALALAAGVLRFAPRLTPNALDTARHLLDSGAAWRKFAAICEAQGGLREIPHARMRRVVDAAHPGICVAIDNRRLARVAKLAGAPRAAAAGLEIHVRLGQQVEKGMPLYTVNAEAPGELEYALSYARVHPDIVRVEDR